MMQTISPETYQVLFEHASDSIFLVEPSNRRVIGANRAASRLLGYTQQSLCQIDFDQLIAPDARQETLQVLLCQDLTQSVHIESTWLHKNGQTFFVLFGIVQIETANGPLWQIIARNVQKHRRRHQEANLLASVFEILSKRQPAEAITEALTLLGQHMSISIGGVVFWLPGSTAFEGWVSWFRPGDEIAIGKLMQSLYGDELPPQLTIHPNSYLEVVLSTRETLYVPNTARSCYWADDIRSENGFYSSLISPLIVREDLKAILVLQSRKIDAFPLEERRLFDRILPAFVAATEAWYVETKLQQLNGLLADQVQRLQCIVDHLPYGFILLDSDMDIIQVNPVAQDYLPMITDCGIGDELITLGDLPIQQLLSGESDEVVWHEAQTKDEQRNFVMTAFAIPTENESQTKNGGQMSVLLIDDVTKERERQRYEQAQQRLATIGQVTAGIAHDFNNVMAAIILYSQILEKSPDLPKRQRYLQTIQQQAKHAAHLTQQVLDFSRQTVMELTNVNMVFFLQELIQLLERMLPETISIYLHSTIDDVHVKVDTTRLQQVLINLAVNARDAMPKGGPLTLRLTRIQVNSENNAPVPNMKPGSWLTLSVEDTGTGMTESILQQAFQPFFTTKPPGSGTGLGLAQAYGIIKQFEGEITIQSEPNKGTLVTIYLPIVNEISYII
ncbi:PAS domain S-box protein [Chloroflexi bacterium TSY]|nr:PAS domain S-box protein [Chloroflexi bacterium TSY]